MPETQPDIEKQPLNRALSNSFENPGPFAREILKARSLSGFSRSTAIEDLGPVSGRDSHSLDEIEEQDEATVEVGEAAKVVAAEAATEATSVTKPVKPDLPEEGGVGENVHPSPKVSFA
eukprot:Protomagalhaensia_sp_Gyna_25__4855@NODE_505_length_3249_cov_226_690966_g396_i0_p4_GENE_NODE_505_length_3249_cov_226_690966_g396_i0NODE_505_length_3249_cov_226_690966_g396_i0_p4_ORF_typecomplete_len119_score22_59_NODE_505_length_3249_cov_226_690966_g396_i08871243